MEQILKKKPVTELRILCTGSRDWSDVNSVRKELMRVIVEAGVRQADVLVIQGGAPGLDTIVKDLCRNELGIACATFEAPWQFCASVGNKRSAGPMRNGWMLRWGVPNRVLAFHPYLPKSKGTKNCLKQARAAGVARIRVISK